MEGGFPLPTPGGGLSTGTSSVEWGVSDGQKGESFWLFQRKGFQHKGGGWFLARGVPASKKNFSSSCASRGWWCSSGVVGWLCKVGGGPFGRAFPTWGQGRF